MNLTEPQKQWIAALRSGEYKQGVNRLSMKGHFCCLGVACELAIKSGVPVRKKLCDSDPTFDDPCVAYDESIANAPDKVQQWLGLCEADGAFSGDDHFDHPLLKFSSLTMANDEGASFEEIADLLEKHPEAVFIPEKR